METHIFILILIVHWIADFLLQSNYMAENKSKEIKPLTIHVVVYSLFWLIPLFSLFDIYHSLMGVFLIFITHFATDYYTSKAHKMLHDDGRRGEFFSSIGFDQLLHYIQLIVIFKIIQ